MTIPEYNPNSLRAQTMKFCSGLGRSIAEGVAVRFWNGHYFGAKENVGFARESVFNGQKQILRLRKGQDIVDRFQDSPHGHRKGHEDPSINREVMGEGRTCP